MKKSFFALLLLAIAACSYHEPPSESLEVGTFNIRFFPCNEDSLMIKKYLIDLRYPPVGVSTDTTLLFNLLRDLDIELLAVQEIVDPPLFAAMAKRHLGSRFEFVYPPFNGWQKTGLLYDSSVLRLIGEPQTYLEVSLGMEDRLRPAFSAYFKTIPDGFDFHALVVHLKSSPGDLDQRSTQWIHLKNIITVLAQGEKKDADIILLGDFNNVSDLRFNEFRPVIREMDFFWTAEIDTTLISSYWRPDWQKPELHGSLIDQIFISQSALTYYVPNSLTNSTICAQGKNPINGEFPAYYLTVSDHCPLWVSFRPFPDND